LAPESHAEPVLAHVLFMDIVGCSKLPSDEQKRIVGRLQELVRQSAEYRQSRDNDRLISLPTGDGMALAFFDRLDAAVRCATEIMQAIQAESLCKIRMGVHTGPVFVMDDINGKRNISGAGINRAERVMSCGGEGHILISDNVAESLRHLSAWRDKIHDVGDCQVKDGWIGVWNLVDGPIGNPTLPAKSKRYVQRRQFVRNIGLSAVALILAAVMAGAFWMGRSGKASRAALSEASIAVLPFVDLSPEKNQEYFSDGLTEELLNGLAKTRGLRVAGSTSCFQFKGKSDDFRSIGDKLNVANILEGSVRKQGNRARIAVQLIKAADGFELWSETFDRDMNDIFAVEEEIGRAIADELKLKLLGKKAAARSEKTADTDCYNAHLQGRYFLERRSKENLALAVGYFEQAIKRDPSFAPAWEGLGESRSYQASAAFVPPEAGYGQARDAVKRALELDPSLADAHVALGSIRMYHDWDWAGADASYRRALELEPGNVRVLRGAGPLAMFLGRLDQAISLGRRATEIDPLSPGAFDILGIALYYAGKEEEATASLKKVLELFPDSSNPHFFLSGVYLSQSRFTEALAEAEREKHPFLRLAAVAVAYHALGRKKESDANLAQLMAKSSDASYQIAEVYAYQGDLDRAFEWLERAYTERDAGLIEIKGDPLLKSLRRDARYATFLKKMHLPL
jgi:TolB-like protein/class 3 adenylate cyclase